MSQSDTHERDRFARDHAFKRVFQGTRANRCIVPRTDVVPGEARMAHPPAAWAYATPEFPDGISPEKWKELGADDRTSVMLHWYMSNFRPNPKSSPAEIDRHMASDTYNYTNISDYLGSQFGSLALGFSAYSIEDRLHPAAKEWIPLSPLQLFDGRHELTHAILSSIAGVSDAYAKLRTSNEPIDSFINVEEFEKLPQVLASLTEAVNNFHGEHGSEATRSLKEMSTALGKGLFEAVGKRAGDKLSPWLFATAIGLYHELLGLVHYAYGFFAGRGM